MGSDRRLVAGRARFADFYRALGANGIPAVQKTSNDITRERQPAGLNLRIMPPKAPAADVS
jgi:hypothetical protein